MRIDIWSDVVCPWCYLGHRRFRAALDELPDLPVEVHWRAYELDPRAPETPEDLTVVLERKYGPGAFDVMTRRLTELGTAEGIDYRFDRTQRVNTFDAHRVILWAAARPHGAEPVAEALFDAYFTKGANVADVDTLLGIVTGVGGDAEDAAAMLAGAEFSDAVRADEAEAVEHAITGVPAFVLAGRLVIPGAQDVDTFVRMLTRAAERFTTPR